MLAGFICPNNQQVSLQTCFEGCPWGRCLTLPTLHLIAQERPFTGTFSTTQLISGTMMEYLKLTKSYYVDPDKRIFMISGTKHHKNLEEVARQLGLPAEIPLSVDRDIFDLIEEEHSQLILTDYKNWGSYKVARALGVRIIGKQPDPSGEVYRSSGKWGKAGSPKMINMFRQFPEEADNQESELQLNNYRIKLGKIGVQIDAMRLQLDVRDGGTQIAESRGVFRHAYLIPIRRLEDSHVEVFFTYKEDCLRQALEHGWTIPCSMEESWEGRRCKDYCEVASFCPKGKLMKEENSEEN